MNHFLRLAVGGMDSLPVNNDYLRQAILPIIPQLDPEERFWHVEGDIIWKVDPWKESCRVMHALRERRAEEQGRIDLRKRVKDELVQAIYRKCGVGLPEKTVDELALGIIHKNAVDVAKEFGVDITILGEGEKLPHEVLTEGEKETF